MKLITANPIIITALSNLKHPKLGASCFLLTSATSRALGSKNSDHQEIKNVIIFPHNK
jgi:hypothetical protein